MAPSKKQTAVARARVIPMNFKQEAGSELWPGCYIGKLLGAGSQAKVYTLVDQDGKSLNRVLKIGHTDIGHTMILNKFAASMMDLQHEWELGVRIMAVLRDEDGYLPGYTSTFDSCVSVDEKTGKAVFRGMVLEQINGYPVRKRLQDPSFSNIKYVREMLYQLLKALDRGQRLLGFTHADMGLGNVMEHYPEVYPEGKYNSPSDIPGFVESGSGSVMPLGPKIEFKIIDYGLVELNDKLAYTAGGTTPVQTIEKLEREISGPVGLDCDEEFTFGPEDTVCIGRSTRTNHCSAFSKTNTWIPASSQFHIPDPLNLSLTHSRFSRPVPRRARPPCSGSCRSPPRRRRLPTTTTTSSSPGIRRSCPVSVSTSIPRRSA